MRLSGALGLASVAMAMSYTLAFTTQVSRGTNGFVATISKPIRLAALGSSTEDCGCGGAILDGKPSDRARSIDPRQAIRNASFLNLNGGTVTFDEILDPSGVSVVVFLRSFG
mmetsp:Transcript_23760/g.42892  ORF Transcript_23760/g.42892 Transcript_23760/m.42892 type:complete len:112 (+) Transcript_23760:374-709(+)